MPESDPSTLPLDRLDAVIFDMDGVVTRTAEAHAAAWKTLFDEYLKARAEDRGESFKPFDKESDYRQFVDGVPRYDGVARFLESRGITLPYGQPDDPPDKETVCGLGNRKNGYFRNWLKTNTVASYDGTLALIRTLRDKGVKTAVFSASRNAEAVLENAGVENLFDAKVDGVDAAEHDLPGKPDPAILAEAARRLGVSPERAAVVEDAIAGVEAGARGGFALVIGVDRGNYGAALKTAGADMVVRDLSELTADPDGGGEGRAIGQVPSFWLHRDELRHRLKETRAAVFLDYDGTLTPIVTDYRKAVLSEDMQDTLADLAARYPVAVISGRDLRDLQNLVRLDSVFYAGSHGFDIKGPKGWRETLKKGEEFLDDLDRAEEALKDAMERTPGAMMERKMFSIAVHFRRVAPDRVADLEDRVERVLADFPDLEKRPGKKVFEIQPKTDWNKGEAIRWLLEQLELDRADVTPLYIGDDITDEDGFRALDGAGIGIVVRGEDDHRATRADYALDGPDDVEGFLDWLMALDKPETAADDWSLVYVGYDPGEEGLRESLCALGNGYFVTRAAAPDSTDDGVHYPGTYLAGGYNRLTSVIKGREIENEDLVNLPNWLPLAMRIDDDGWIRPVNVDFLEYRQELDVRRGFLLRFLRFQDGAGRVTRWEERRFVSMRDPHVAGLSVSIVPENWSGRLGLKFGIDGSVTNDGVDRYQGLQSRHLETASTDQPDGDTVRLKSRMVQARREIAEAARTRLYRGPVPIAPERRTEIGQDATFQETEIAVKEGERITAEKLAALYNSSDVAISEAGLAAYRKVADLPRFDALLEAHALAWRHLWAESDLGIDLDPDDAAQITLRLHTFHLLQTISYHSGALDVGVPPRGWHGEAYRGHILWDELFIFPLLNLRMPALTRSLLKYRYNRLEEAKRVAAAAGFKGAMYPWQSGSSGREESQELHLNPVSGHWVPDNSHRQRHVTAAVAHNVWQYYQVTNDHDFLYFFGAEMLLEIARFWASIAEYDDSDGRYVIRGVMGPDEFHTAYPDRDPSTEGGLDNNAYTNVMAAASILHAIDALALLPDERRQSLCERLGIDDEEIEQWDDVSRGLRIPIRRNGIIDQFEGYGDLEEFDWDAAQQRYGNIQRLDRLLEADGDDPNRYKASKQADVLMLFYLFSADELHQLFERLGYRFDPAWIRKNIDYYLSRTAHGSTLSWVVHSWVSARAQRRQSWELFQKALKSDVCDIQGGTTAEGIHLGAMAGTVDIIQRCYTGIEARGNVLHFNPCLPPEMTGIRFRLRYRRQILDIDVNHDRLRIASRPFTAPPITIAYRGQFRDISPGQAYEFRLIQPDAHH